MNQKQLLLGALLSLSAQAFEPGTGLYANRVNHHPVVRADSYCTTAVDRLFKKPEDPSVAIAEGNKWVDDSFTGKGTLYYSGIQSDATIKVFDDGLADGSLYFDSWMTRYPNAHIFDTTDGLPDWREPRQGGAGTCYLMQSLSGVAEFPELIRNAFVTKTKNSVGINQLKFFIRGKPWILNVDDQFLFKLAFSNDANYHNALKFAFINTYETKNTVMWAPILEKAWAKIKGNYEMADGGFIATGLKTITGAPVFANKISDIPTKFTLDQVFDTLVEANTLNYIMAAGTGSGSDSETNACGIAKGHAYAIIEPFTMTDSSNVVHKMLLMRNPWGKTGYSSTWNKDDSNWTPELIAQVPKGVDPTQVDSTTNSANFGIFTMPLEKFGPQTNSADNCIADFEIAHYRDDAGYMNTWYDRDDSTEKKYSYTVTLPAKDGDLYFSAQSWYYNMIPTSCQSGQIESRTSTTLQDGKGYPLVYLGLYKEGTASQLSSVYYYDQMSYPILYSDYTAGTKFTLDVYYMFPLDHPKKDYTVRLYSKQRVTIYDSDDKSNMLHMDGTTPSGFDEDQTTTPPTTPTDPDPSNPWAGEGVVKTENLFEVTSLKQLIVSTESTLEFVFILMIKPGLAFEMFESFEVFAYSMGRLFGPLGALMLSSFSENIASS